VPTVRYLGPQISYDIADDRHRPHSQKHWSVHTHAAVTFNEQCRLATIIKSFDCVIGWPVSNRTALWQVMLCPVRNNTNTQPAMHLLHHRRVGTNNGITLLVLSYSSLMCGHLAVTHVSETTGQMCRLWIDKFCCSTDLATTVIRLREFYLKVVWKLSLWKAKINLDDLTACSNISQVVICHCFSSSN